jgi:hypothetical protein
MLNVPTPAPRVFRGAYSVSLFTPNSFFGERLVRRHFIFYYDDRLESTNFAKLFAIDSNALTKRHIIMAPKTIVTKYVIKANGS